MTSYCVHLPILHIETTTTVAANKIVAEVGDMAPLTTVRRPHCLHVQVLSEADQYIISCLTLPTSIALLLVWFSSL